MQWLIDLIIEAIGIPPCYIDRGDFLGDFEAIDAKLNAGTFQTVDFSSVVPAGAKAVVIRLRAQNTVAGESVEVQPFGTQEGPGHCSFEVTVANIICRRFITVGVDADRKIKIRGTVVGLWSYGSISLRGWIL